MPVYGHGCVSGMSRRVLCEEMVASGLIREGIFSLWNFDRKTSLDTAIWQTLSSLRWKRWVDSIGYDLAELY